MVRWHSHFPIHWNHRVFPGGSVHPVGNKNSATSELNLPGPEANILQVDYEV